MAVFTPKKSNCSHSGNRLKSASLGPFNHNTLACRQRQYLNDDFEEMAGNVARAKTVQGLAGKQLALVINTDGDQSI